MSVAAPPPPLQGLRNRVAEVKEGNGNTAALPALVLPLLDHELNNGVQTLRVLHIAGAGSFRFTYQDVKALTDGVVDMALPIEDLALTNHNFGDNGARHCSRLLQNLGKYRCKLSRLCLKGNQIREAGARAIKQAATLNSTLTHLDLSWNPIERQGCFDLAELLQRSGTLHELVLSSVDMPQACFIAMLTILADNKVLTALNVENCRLFSREDIVPSHIKRMLLQNKTLRKLRCGKNGLVDQGVETICQALQLNHSLDSLYLQSNRISATGAEALASLLLKHPVLVELDLEANRITNEGARALGLALTHNRSLRTLNVRFNSISDDGLTDLLAGMRTNSSITKLYTWGNHYGEQASRLFRELETGRFALLGVVVDVTTYVVDDAVTTAEVVVPKVA